MVKLEEDNINSGLTAAVFLLLGAPIPSGSVTSIGDFNQVTTVGCFTCNPSSMQNKPSDMYGTQGFVLVQKSNTGLIQRLSTNLNEVFERVKYSADWWPWRRLDNFSCTTPADLASLLGVGHLVHIQQENIVIPKGNNQAILACSINGTTYQPSLFLLGRKSGIIAISEEGGPVSNHMSFNDNGDIVVTGYGAYHFYYRLWLME